MLRWMLDIPGVVLIACLAGVLGGRVMDTWDLTRPIFDAEFRRRSRLHWILQASIYIIPGITLLYVDPEVRNSPALIWVVAAVLFFVALAVPGPILVSEQGLVRPHAIRGPLLVSWDDLDHYELSRGTWGVSDIYYIRTSSGRTLKINDSAQDVPALLHEIERYRTLERLPFHRPWYMGRD
jgi:hypothetical protein